MAWNQDSRGHEMIYLASGIAIGALGASLVLSDNGTRRRLTHALGVEAPKEHGSFWPWGALIVGGAVVAGVASMAPEIARYIKIEMM
ncbi:MAG TPA: hypothetical protein VGP76_11065 [Planctomycetaceae bacterium]|jgi:hypothetical protein|nr:hypothetical protein [Planctomycetaceae bacterium]